MSSDCIFCKIIAGSLPAKIIAENDAIIVIEDIAPKAPTHYLVIPKKHIKDLKEADSADAQLLAEIMLMAKELSKKLQGSGDFRLLINNGSGVGQSVFHLHAHFLAGKQMHDF